MKLPAIFTIGLLAGVLSACGGGQSVTSNAIIEESVDNAKLVTLGDVAFTDTGLSANNTVSCQSCHISAATAFADPGKRFSKGINGSSTVRNSPMLHYVGLIPALANDGSGWVGGLFLDGRADSLAEQIRGPLLGSHEMGNADVKAVITRLCNNTTTNTRIAFTDTFGADSLSVCATPNPAAIETTLQRLGRAFAALQSTPAFQPFSSKYDAYLQGKTSLTTQESQGLGFFVRSDKGNCAACHVINRSNPAKQPVFTDFTYDNLGVPSKSGEAQDPGLFATAKVKSDPTLLGKFRVPTLRNVAVTAPYMHNGIFSELKDVVDFYNTRDTDPRWESIGATDYPETVNHSELGNLKLSNNEIDAIVAFLNTLTDGYTAP